MRLFAPASPYDRMVLAVSGGADSMALMLLAAQWLQSAGRPLQDALVATVDHGLRPYAADEAAFAAAAARRLGFSHETLLWRAAKPVSGLQQAAREARYRLLREFAAAHDAPAILTGHHSGDQAETFLMRLSRGSGLDGLAAMAPVTRYDGVDIVRPLLDRPGAWLRSFLEAGGHAWIEDPSNADETFERVRLRRTLAALSRSGVHAAAIAHSAQRLRRAHDALEAAASELAWASVAAWPAGWARLDCGRLSQAPDELFIRIMARALVAYGGGMRPARLAKIEALCARLKVDPPAQLTLGGCLIRVQGGALWLFREAGRIEPASLNLQPGESAMWDGRFRVSLRAEAQTAVGVAALGADGLKIVKQARRRPREKFGLPPYSAAIATPAFRRGGELIAAPLLGFALGEGHCEAVFVNEFVKRPG